MSARPELMISLDMELANRLLLIGVMITVEIYIFGAFRWSGDETCVVGHSSGFVEGQTDNFFFRISLPIFDYGTPKINLS